MNVIQSLQSRYHIYHPLHKYISEGKASKTDIQLWVANRFYYQKAIPKKDAYIMANCPDVRQRRRWIQRIIDHDRNDGGLDAWIRLGEAVDLKENVLWSDELLLPGVQHSVDAYVNFARDADWRHGMVSSLTEAFAPEIHKDRLKAWPQHYDWIDHSGYDYFKKRLSEAKRDVNHGLEIAEELDDDTVRDIVSFKLNVLWCMSDAIYNHIQHNENSTKDDIVCDKFK